MKKNWRYYIAKYLFLVPEGFSFGTDNRLKVFWMCLGIYLISKSLPKSRNYGVTWKWVMSVQKGLADIQNLN